MSGSVCEAFEARDIRSRYAAGTLSDADAEEFERHLVGCVDCQQSVRMGAAIRQGLDRGDPIAKAVSRRTMLPLFAAIAIAATIVLAFGVQLLSESGLRRLGALQAPPGYAGIEVRSASGTADSLFTEGMRQYAAQRYDEARSALEGARARGAEPLRSAFFIGVIHLMRGDEAAAIREMNTVVGHGDSPYLAEAHYYLGKAWLQTARVDSALAHLDQSIRDASPVMLAARALRDSVTGGRTPR